MPRAATNAADTDTEKKPARAKTPVKVKDLKPNKDAKGGYQSGGHGHREIRP